MSDTEQKIREHDLFNFEKSLMYNRLTFDQTRQQFDIAKVKSDLEVLFDTFLSSVANSSPGIPESEACLWSRRRMILGVNLQSSGTNLIKKLSDKLGPMSECVGYFSDTAFL